MTVNRTCSNVSSDSTHHSCVQPNVPAIPSSASACDLMPEAQPQHEFHPRFVSNTQDQHISRADSGAILESKPIIARTIRGLITGASIGSTQLSLEIGTRQAVFGPWRSEARSEKHDFHSRAAPDISGTWCGR